MPIEPLTPRPDPPGEGYSSKVVTSVGRQRFELTVRVESREIVRGPADVIAEFDCRYVSTLVFFFLARLGPFVWELVRRSDPVGILGG